MRSLVGFSTSPIVATLLCCWSFVARATTIVVVRTPVDVSIAADSLGTFSNHVGTVTEGPVCKIYQSGATFLGVAGIDNDPTTKFSVAESALPARRDGWPLSRQMDAAEIALIKALRSEAAYLKAHDPVNFGKLTARDIGGVQIIFVGLEGGVPSAVGEQLTVSDVGSTISVIRASRQQCPGSDCPNGVYTFELGSHAAIDRYLSLQGTRSFSGSELAKTLVQLEIDARTPGVGGPIDLLRINAKGPEWIQQKAGCPKAIQHPISGRDRPSKRQN
jgi:hypothetical protein